MDGFYICGGSKTLTSCLKFSSGQWITSSTLIQERELHSSWMSEEGLVLMGGNSRDSIKNSELIETTGGDSIPYFDMEYDTK